MCPACTNKRPHGPDDWKHHPYRGHGFNGTVWTHNDLLPHDVVHHVGAANTLAAGISGEVHVAKAGAAPTGEALRELQRRAGGKDLRELALRMNGATPEQIAQAMEQMSTDALEFGVKFEGLSHPPTGVTS